MFVALAARLAARQRRDDLRAGVVAAAALNATRSAKTKPEPYKPGDFFPHHRSRRDRLAAIRATTGALVARRTTIPAAEGRAIFAAAAALRR